MTLDEFRAAVLRGENSSMSIMFNEHASSYRPLSEIIEDDPDWFAEDTFVGGADGMRRCIEANAMWTLQFYPDTPIGFHILRAPTFEEVRAAAVQLIKEDGR